jgi:uncharacterized membrane protein
MGPQAIQSAIELESPSALAFSLLREAEKWPVWLSFLRTVHLVEPGPLRLGSELLLRSAIPGESEELFEVERLLEGHILSLVGAYSLRRRLEFRVEAKSQTCRVVARMDYPTYGGALGALFDRLTVRPRLASDLDRSLEHFKGLAESDDAFGGL